MSAFKTLYITRAKAIEYLFDKTAITDRELQDMLNNGQLDGRLYNVRVVPNNELENDDEVL